MDPTFICDVKIVLGQKLFEQDAYLSETRIGSNVVFDEVTARNAQMGLALSHWKTTKWRCKAHSAKKSEVDGECITTQQVISNIVRIVWLAVIECDVNRQEMEVLILLGFGDLAVLVRFALPLFFLLGGGRFLKF